MKRCVRGALIYVHTGSNADRLNFNKFLVKGKKPNRKKIKADSTIRACQGRGVSIRSSWKKTKEHRRVGQKKRKDKSNLNYSGVS